MTSIFIIYSIPVLIFIGCVFLIIYFVKVCKNPNVNIDIAKPAGKTSSGEERCRVWLETTFKQPFKKIRPNWLHNPISGGANLELDCYNDDLKLAVEYNGRQHYEHVPYFHKTKTEFQNQQYRDILKNQMCEKNGVRLITVPYSVTDIEDYLEKQLLNFLP